MLNSIVNYNISDCMSFMHRCLLIPLRNYFSYNRYKYIYAGIMHIHILNTRKIIIDLGATKKVPGGNKTYVSLQQLCFKTITNNISLPKCELFVCIPSQCTFYFHILIISKPFIIDEKLVKPFVVERT